MIKLELSPEMLNVISQALGLAPYNAVAPVIAELQRQINAQQKGVPTVDEMEKEVKAAA